MKKVKFEKENFDREKINNYSNSNHQIEEQKDSNSNANDMQ